MRSARILLLSSLVVVSTASTCATGTPPIDLDDADRGRLMPNGRVAIEFLPGVGKRRRGALNELIMGDAPIEGRPRADHPVRTVEPTISLVGEVTRVTGRASEPIPAGRNVELDAVLLGPGVVAIDVENVRGLVAARPGVRFVDRVTIEGIIGLGIDDTQIRVRSAGVAGQNEDLRVGFALGGRVSVRLIPLFDVYAQGVGMLAESSVTRDFEVGSVLNISPRVGVHAGYRDWEYRERTVRGGSNAELEFSGPTLGLDLTF